MEEVMSNPQPTHLVAMSTWTQVETERAFKRATRARRRAALVSRVKRRGRRPCGLAVYDETRRSATDDAHERRRSQLRPRSVPPKRSSQLVSQTRASLA
jgi:hypothetical protein